jgi:peptide/nickel transport system permease protein
MKRYILKRLLYALLTLWLTSMLIFAIARILPGDPVQGVLMASHMGAVDSNVIEGIRAQFGLNQPLIVQYLIWVKNFITGDWGVSIASGEKVFDMFMKRLPITFELFVCSVLWSMLIGFPCGIISAVKRGGFIDRLLSAGAVLGLSLPVFWEGIILIYLFSVMLHILPPSGFVPFSDSIKGNLLSIAMPSFIMGTQGAGLISRYVRSSLLEVLGQDFIRTAYAKGYNEIEVLLRHALKPALLPVATVTGMTWGYVTAGSFIVEYMFAIPGLGRMGVNAIFSSDFPVIQATLIIVAINILAVNLLVDLQYGYLDPRIRVQS